ncbi:MAG: hypothetical protein E6P95_01665 [Candidatus Moraniibacteriota bacterium]|nr:MAG: hypothetical protein E6P95_01665 [Candidatus Moranbacteria bacterium]
MTRSIEGCGLSGAQDVDFTYGRVIELATSSPRILRKDAMGNPVMQNRVNPHAIGIPTGPEGLNIPTVVKVDATGNPVMMRYENQYHIGIPTGPESIVMASNTAITIDSGADQAPSMADANRIFSPTDFPLPI